MKMSKELRSNQASDIIYTETDIFATMGHHKVLMYNYVKMCSEVLCLPAADKHIGFKLFDEDMFFGSDF
jgi:hypothetical protein